MKAATFYLTRSDAKEPRIMGVWAKGTRDREWIVSSYDAVLYDLKGWELQRAHGVSPFLEDDELASAAANALMLPNGAELTDLDASSLLGATQEAAKCLSIEEAGIER